MKQSILKSVTHFLICLFLAGAIPVSPDSSLSVLHAEAAKKKKKKKKNPPHGQPGHSHNPPHGQPGHKHNEKKQKSSSKKSKKKKSEKTTSAVAVDPQSTVKKGSRINAAAYADELFNLTGELKSSNKELARAARYFQVDGPLKKAVALDSRPFFSKEDFEKEARLNPDNLYSQRQLGLHYEANGEFSSAKDVYLREVAKNPGNPEGI